MPRDYSLNVIRALAVIALLGLAGCETTSSRSSKPASDRLIVGLTTTQLDELLGDPEKVEPATMFNRAEETRHYTIAHTPEYRDTVAEMKDVPFVDPITGVMRMIKEPIVDQQRIERNEQITVVIQHDHVINIDRRIVKRSSFSR